MSKMPESTVGKKRIQDCSGHSYHSFPNAPCMRGVRGVKDPAPSSASLRQDWSLLCSPTKLAPQSGRSCTTGPCKARNLHSALMKLEVSSDSNSSMWMALIVNTWKVRRNTCLLPLLSLCVKYKANVTERQGRGKAFVPRVNRPFSGFAVDPSASYTLCNCW